MHIHLTRFTPNAVAFLVASALLAGCAGATNVTPPQNGGLGTNSKWATRVVADGHADFGIARNREKLTSTSGSGRLSSCSVSINVSGKAGGTYHGTFAGGGDFSSCPRHPGFEGSFAITSGANKITGSFFGTGQGSCGRAGCGDGGKITYKATLEPGGKTFAANGFGRLVLSPRGSGASMYLSLQSM